MPLDDDILDQHAQRRRALLTKAPRIVAAGPAMALLLEGGLMPKRAAAYGSATNINNPIITTTPPAVTGSGGFLTDRCGVVVGSF